MDLPLNNTIYKELGYWEERYKEEECYDWFAGYSAFREHVVKTLHADDKILMLGCGNSKLSEDMYVDGFRNIVNMDYSPIVIENMAQKCANLPEMTWRVVDIKAMSFDEAEFEAVIEKGTLDALLVDEKDPWDISDDGADMMDNILQQISRFLKPDGHFISITFAQPHFRKPLYAKTQFQWAIDTVTFGDTFHYFVYNMTKGRTLSETDTALEKRHAARRNVPKEEVVYLTDSDDDDFLLSNMTLGINEKAAVGT